MQIFINIHLVSHSEERASISKTNRWMTHKEIITANCGNHIKAHKYAVGNKQFSLLNLAVYVLISRLKGLRTQKYKTLQFGDRQTTFSLRQSLRKIRHDLLYKPWTDMYILYSLLSTIRSTKNMYTHYHWQPTKKATCDGPAISSDMAPEARAVVFNTRTNKIGARRGPTLIQTNWQSVTHNATLASRCKWPLKKGCRVIVCTRTCIPHMGNGSCPPQYGVAGTRCTPTRVSQNGLHSSLNDPKQFLQGQAWFADSPTSSLGTRSRVYRQTSLQTKVKHSERMSLWNWYHPVSGSPMLRLGVERDNSRSLTYCM